MIKHFHVAVMTVSAVAMLAGCSASQPPLTAPRVMPQSRNSISYKSIFSFGTHSDGQQPKAALINVNGTLYGTTFAGGRTGCGGSCGTLFKIKSSGKETVLYRFTGGMDGANPSASLLAVEGVLYGTTEYGGGEVNGGTVFKISTTGLETVLHGFGPIPEDGVNPVASLIDVKGKLYGTTYSGGPGGDGTVFRINKSGKEKVLCSFGLYYAGNVAASLLDVKGTLYGTTELGGQFSSFGYGTVFSVTRTGAEHGLYNFDDSDGYYPAAGLINVNGTLYGTTEGGGAYGGLYGTAFSITTTGSLTTLHSFGYGSDGSNPWAALLNVGGTLYGTTAGGGTYGKGTIFSMSLSGNENVLHSFGYGTDGATPLAGLVDVKGTLYGTTSAGGTYGDGTVFSLNP